MASAAIRAVSGAQAHAGFLHAPVAPRRRRAFPSERKCLDGSCSRATADVFRQSLAEAAARHLPAWAGKLTPHVLRHFCASQRYLAGMSLFAIQELLGHSWTGTTAPLAGITTQDSC